MESRREEVQAKRIFLLFLPSIFLLGFRRHVVIAFRVLSAYFPFNRVFAACFSIDRVISKVNCSKVDETLFFRVILSNDLSLSLFPWSNVDFHIVSSQPFLYSLEDRNTKIILVNSNLSLFHLFRIFLPSKFISFTRVSRIIILFFFHCSFAS